LTNNFFGLDEYLRDLGWTTTRVRPGITDDEVVNLAKDNRYIVASLDKKLLSRCRVMGIPSVNLELKVQPRIVHGVSAEDHTEPGASLNNVQDLGVRLCL